MNSGKILVAGQDGTHVMKFVGDVRVVLSNAIDNCISAILGEANFKSIYVDLTEAEGIDSTSLGLLAKMSIQAKARCNVVPTIISTNDNITKILFSMGLERMFSIIEEPMPERADLKEYLAAPGSENSLKRKVIDAHRVLMDINENNEIEFHDLVETLENELKRDSK